MRPLNVKLQNGQQKIETKYEGHIWCGNDSDVFISYTDFVGYCHEMTCKNPGIFHFPFKRQLAEQVNKSQLSYSCSFWNGSSLCGFKPSQKGV